MINPSAFSLDQALMNLSDAFTNIKLLILAISYVIGVFFIVTGLMKYRIFANQTFGSAQRGEMAGPLIYILIGALLCYYPSTVQTSLQTIFGTSEIGAASELISYSSLGSEKWKDIADVVIQYLYLIGLIAFTRGWVILAKIGHSGGSQQGGVGKGLIHVIGGILLINLVDAIHILGATFGYTG